MNTKLTLTLEKSVIERAKRYAKASGRSLSDLIENYLDKITKDHEISESETEFADLFGSVKLPNDLNDKLTIRKIMSEKHSS